MKKTIVKRTVGALVIMSLLLAALPMTAFAAGHTRGQRHTHDLRGVMRGDCLCLELWDADADIEFRCAGYELCPRFGGGFGRGFCRLN